MKKLSLVLSIALLTLPSYAQDVSIPLFDDDAPKIGRNAQPLESLILTPSPLPAISVNLTSDTSKDKEAEAHQDTTGSATTSTPAPSQQKNTTDFKIDPPRTEPISIAKDKKNNAADLIADLQKELANAQGASSISADSYQPSQPALPDVYQKPTPVLPDVKPALPAKAPETPSVFPIKQTTSAVQTPASLEGLFGQTHDVRGFAVSGMTLGMTPEEVDEIADIEGFQLVRAQRGITLFRTSYYEHLCRNAKVYVLDHLRDCIRSHARADQQEYISSMTFKKPETKEYIQILFSSPATDNVSYKIYYENEGDNSLTLTQKNLAKQLRRKEAFWRLMFETYGLPDDSELIIWGDPQKSYMQATMQGTAYNAYIVLEDKEIQDEDYFAQEEEARDLTYKMPFSFAGAESEE